jgi:hypothetical protein
MGMPVRMSMCLAVRMGGVIMVVSTLVRVRLRVPACVLVVVRVLVLARVAVRMRRLVVMVTRVAVLAAARVPLLTMILRFHQLHLT